MIRIYKTENGIVFEKEGRDYQSEQRDWDALINQNDLYRFLAGEIHRLGSLTLPSSTGINMMVERNAQIMFEGSPTIDQVKRTHEELVEFLYRECDFPVGCYLMTGTCVVAGNDFTLQSKDKVTMTIEQIGRLVNIVE